jgi:hypothetical protein
VLSFELSGPKVVSDSTSSVQTFELAQKWLRNCLENHDGCNDGFERWRPTRLVKLDSPSKGMVTLDSKPQETAISEVEAYVTLSHCWGDGDPLKLTSSTFPSLAEGVPVSKLPQTFQDAIIIARRLGSEFIWIDSLCIIQDSHEDWLRQSSLMGKVYAQALCNIGATDAANGDGGCFRQRNPLLLDRTIIESSWTDRTNKKFHLYATPGGMTNPLHSPLLRRGWVLQEYILSRRFLHFEAQQMAFECKEGYVSEMYPEKAPKGMLLFTDPLQKAEEPRYRIDHGAGHIDAPELYNFWGKLVEYYSTCSLTFDTDKLIAISGIAKTLQGTLHDTYYAGMWKSQLPQSLLWVLDPRERDRTTQSSSYLAPTWSWAGSNAAIHGSVRRRGTIIAEVVQTQVALASSDPTGSVLSGSITLRGMLWTVVLHCMGGMSYFIRVKPMVQSYRSDPQFGAFQEVYIDNPIPVGQQVEGIKLHYMPIRRVSRSEEEASLGGLLLLPTGQRGQFERVGVFRFEQSRVNPVDLDAFVSAPNNDWLEYEDFDGVDKYTITIV